MHCFQAIQVLHNVAIGNGAGDTNTTGGQNVIIGKGASTNQTTASNNVVPR